MGTSSGRRWARRALAAVAGLTLLYLAFETGRWAAGYSIVEAVVTQASLESRLAEQASATAALQSEKAGAGVRRTIDREASREAQRMLGQLQAEVARQQQELQFYRGVLAREFGAGTLRVQDLTVRRPDGQESGSFVLDAMLVQAGGRDTVARGELALTIEGTQAGALMRLPLAEVTDGRRRSVPFSLRYFQALQIPVTLPAGFAPASVTVELRSAAAGPSPERQTFPWRLGATGTLTPGSRGE
jgi:hypothetical protein